MMMNPKDFPLYYWPYELYPKKVLNAVSDKEPRKGLLIRNSQGGVGCVQPWPELGDSSLKEEWEGLRIRQPLALGKQALLCAQQDAIARHEGKSLFSEENPVPESHATLSDTISVKELLQLHDAGFRKGKVKYTGDFSLFFAQLRDWSILLPDWKWRLDFNGTLDPSVFPKRAAQMQDALRGKIDFFEDPVPYDLQLWSEWSGKGIPLALDRHTEGFSPLTRGITKVWKPAVEDQPKDYFHKIVVTSYMDHPVGQSWAAFQAARILAEGLPVVVCGLITHHLYEKHAFSEELGGISPRFSHSKGTGLGFHDLLDQLPWKKIG